MYVSLGLKIFQINRKYCHETSVRPAVSRKKYHEVKASRSKQDNNATDVPVKKSIPPSKVLNLLSYPLLHSIIQIWPFEGKNKTDSDYRI